MTSEPVVGDVNTGERPAEPSALLVGGLLALALAGFITILTETLPAGLLPQIGATLDVAQPGSRPRWPPALGGHCW